MKVFGHGTTTGVGRAINTRASFVELATEAEVDGVELDVRRTADDQLVVIHDDRYADGGLVLEMSADSRPPDVLLLADALDLCVGLRVNIELKNHPTEPTFDPDERIADVCARLLDDRGTDDVIVSCFGLACIDRLIRVRPHTPTALLLLSRRPVDEIVVAAVSERHRAVHPYISMVDAEFMRRCRSLDLQVNVWSGVDESDEAVQALLDHGVDGLITESPERALRLRAQVERAG